MTFNSADHAAAFVLGALVGVLVGAVLTTTLGAIVFGVIFRWKRDRR